MMKQEVPPVFGLFVALLVIGIYFLINSGLTYNMLVATIGVILIYFGGTGLIMEWKLW